MCVWIAASIIGFIVAVKVIYTLYSGRCRSEVRLDGKTVIVTGASAGIGKETARDLAARGARVIMACRNLEKAQRIADEIINDTGNGEVVVRELDTSDFASVRKFAKGILATEKRLDVLVNNAGIGGLSTRTLTKDGIDLTMATNHFGHFLLTNLLIDLLKSSAPSRIINVSSGAHRFCNDLKLDGFDYEKQYPGPVYIYSQSKLANILFSLELSEKLKGTGITVNSLNPGVVNTEIVTKSDKRLLTYFIALLFWIMGKNEKLGAQTTIYLSVSEEVKDVTGKYFTDCQITVPSKLASDTGLSKKLWEFSEEIVGLSQEERSL